jgi:hypothetical protein
MRMSVAAMTRNSPATSEVEQAHELDVGQVLLGDARERDVVDVDLVALDQVQEEVERTLEALELDLVSRHRPPTFPPALRIHQVHRRTHALHRRHRLGARARGALAQHVPDVVRVLLERRAAVAGSAPARRP